MKKICKVTCPICERTFWIDRKITENDPGIHCPYCDTPMIVFEENLPCQEVEE